MPDETNIFSDISPEEEAALSPDQPEPAQAPEPEPAPAQPDPEPAPEPVPPAEPADDADGKPPKGFVPYNALYAERKERQALEAEVAALRKWREETDKRLNPLPEPPKYVDPLTDPDGHAKWAAHQDAERVRHDREITEFRQEQHERAQQQRMVGDLQRLEGEFHAKTPDYQEAVRYLGTARAKELELLGFTAEQAVQATQQEARSLVIAALQNGRNPAEVAYGIARARGYATAAPKDAAADAAAEATQLEKVAAASRSLGAAPGGGVAGELTLAEVAEMSPEEIAAIPEHQRRRIMGG